MTKTNRFKDITTVFVIGTFFMVHGNCFMWGIFLVWFFLFLFFLFFAKVRVQQIVVNVCVFFFFFISYWTSFYL